MNERWKGFGERIQRLNPLWSLGRGMVLGGLTDYAQMLTLSLLLEVFYRELDNNPLRTRSDLIDAAKEMIQDMDLDHPHTEVQTEQLERLVDGLLWSKDPALQQPFTAKWFDEKQRRTETQIFRYLKEDRQHSAWAKGGNTVYQLTEEALEIIFMSREWLQEIEVSIDQMYIQQQMKRGNFGKALRGLDDLLARVRRLIQQEQEYQEDIRRNPKIIFQQGGQLRSKREAEIKNQFQEEKARFDELLYTLHRLSGAPTEEIRSLHEKIEYTRRVHDQLAQVVLHNLSMEIELRYKYPHLFWKQSTVTFRQTIWEDWIQKQGMIRPDAMEYVLQPLFSPQAEFIFPLDWVWGEHDLDVQFQQDLIQEEEEVSEETAYEPHLTDWNEIVDLWRPILIEVIHNGTFSLSQLRNVSEEVQERWLRQKEAIDLWLMFFGTPLEVPLFELDQKYTDERLLLLYHVWKENESIRRLEGRILSASIEPGQSMIRWKGVVLTPFRLDCKEEKE